MVGNGIIGDIMSFKYTHGKLGILIEISDVEGDCSNNLNDIERATLVETIDLVLVSFFEAVNVIRKGKESQNGLEGQNEGMGRG